MYKSTLMKCSRLSVKDKFMKLKLVLLLLPVLSLALSCTDAAKPLGMTNANENLPAKNANETLALSETGHDDAHDAPRISLADAKKDYDAGDAIIIDVRDVNAYKNEHVKGALNVPLADLDANIDKLPKGKKIIAYCS